MNKNEQGAPQDSNFDSSIEIQVVRAYQDNYCYLISKRGSASVACIDACETAPILKALTASGRKLGAILTTHHHHDHVGGNLELSSEFKCPVYCSSRDFNRVPGATHALPDGKHFHFEGIEIHVMSIPGHTQGQIAFYIPAARALFVGDTVFEMGCGRLFEGSAQDMFTTIGKIKSLPPDTRIFVGHEYTETNSRFALRVEPANAAAIERRLSDVRTQIKSAGFADAPTLSQEQTVNPFFRAKTLEEFTRLRLDRDSFK